MQGSNTPKVVGALVISAALIIGVYFVVSSLGSDPETSNTTSTVSVTKTESSNDSTDTTATAESPIVDSVTAEQAAVLVYADGTYSVSQSYRVPEGHTEDISIELTLSGDKISAIAVDTVASNDESAQYQSGFDTLIVGEVEGKTLDDADVSRLGGASLTSNAFNDLLEAVRNEART